jgi:hypothetical protein
MSEIETAIAGDNAPERQVTGLSRIDRVNRWLTLAANLGVMFGLIVLIVEVQQSANLARVSLETERSEAQMVIELRMTDPAVAAVWEKSIYAPSDLSLSELRIMDAILVSHTMNYDRLLSMMDGKLINRARVQQHIGNTAPFVLGSAFGKNWWRQNAVGWQGTPLYEIADPIIAEVPDDFLANYYASLQLAPPAELEAK